MKAGRRACNITPPGVRDAWVILMRSWVGVGMGRGMVEGMGERGGRGRLGKEVV